jgi:capsular exopolysaccharide synthesis family protein
MMNLMLAVVVGLVGGAVLAFFVEYLDNTFKLPHDVKEYLGLSYLGPVPGFSKKITQEGVNEDLVLIHAPKSIASESFRGVRTGVLFSSVDVKPQVILVASAGPEEGKSCLVANLGITLAMAGSKVLILDCDMRKPRQHTLFNCSRENGVSSVLVGTSALSEVVVHTRIENLDLIPCGPIPPNPSEIVGSNKLKQLIDALRKGYQHILIDSPPITAVTDAVLLSQACDSVLLIIRAGVTPKPLVRHGVEQLHAVNAHIMGAVLNGIGTGKDSYCDYPYYSYYYGDDMEKPGKSRRKNTCKGA